jgi:tRNA(adenine34) deaminase
MQIMKDSPGRVKYETWMRRCIALARIAQARGDSPVGAVIVRNGEVVAEGIEAGKSAQDITRHAEVEAISVARKVLDPSDLSDCLLVTTHEPCILCSYAIRHHRIPLVVFGVAVGEIGGYNSELAVLKERSVKRWGEAPQLISGVLEDDCLALQFLIG